MWSGALLLAAAGLLWGGEAVPVVVEQKLLGAEKGRELKGRFLQITGEWDSWGKATLRDLG